MELTSNRIVHSILIPSLIRLYAIDFDNIRLGVSERNICARLAHHMENIIREYDNSHNDSPFTGYFVDVEYNRMGNGDIKQYENSEHRPKRMVCDLLIQSRGLPENLLAVEMKREGNSHCVEFDKVRLKSMVSTTNHLPNCVYNTLVGAFVSFSVDGVNVELFKSNESGSGESFGVLTFKCINEGDIITLRPDNNTIGISFE